MPAHGKVLLLYTGGTIGMQQSAEGLAPARGFDQCIRGEQQRQSRTLASWEYRELLPPIDSANMTPAHWLRMAEAIREGIQETSATGVVVLHGTDTLAYSAAALSFLLLGLPVPVVLTGSMLPATSSNSDAWDNLFGAMQVLEEGLPLGVWLFFHGKTLPGTHASKLDASRLDAFAVLPRQRHSQRATSVPPELDYRRPRQLAEVALLSMYPGIGAGQVQAVLDTGVRGLLLECYGSGTGPADDVELLEVLRAAHERGVVLAAISQCPQGHVDFGLYAAGNRLAACGVISGGGMTREAALGKLFALLSAGLTQAEVERWFSLDLCGERAD